MFKLRFSKPKYSVKNKNGKMVTYCTFMCSLMHKGIVLAVNRFTASTTCSENDTYNEIEGRHLAESKCKLLAYKKTFNSFKKYHQKIEEEYLDVTQFFNHMEHMVNSEKTHVEYLMNRETV